MSTFCEIRQNTKAVKNLAELSETLGSSAAAEIITWNNGHQIDMAPNGKPSKLFESLLEITNGDRSEAIRMKALTYTTNFRDWFGDWVTGDPDTSKFVDENGEPKIFWHGTDQKFDTFELDVNYERGKHLYHDPHSIWFTDSQEKAFKYKHSYTMPVYLKANNYGEVFADEKERVNDIVAENEIITNPLYDSAIFHRYDKENPELTTQYVVKDPLQVKSIFNHGEFSKENANIYHHKDLQEIYSSEANRLQTIISSMNIYDAARYIGNYNRKFGSNFGVFIGQNGTPTIKKNLNTLIETNRKDKFARAIKFGEVAPHIQSYLQSKFPNLKFKKLSETEFKLFYQQFKPGTKSYPNSFIYNDTIYIRNGKINADILIEEFLHPLVHDYKINNPKIFNQLVSEATRDFPQLAEEIGYLYQSNTNDIMAEELLAQATARYLRREIEIKQNLNSNTLINFLQYCTQRIIGFFKDIFGETTSLINPVELTAKDLNPESISELVKMINSKEALFRLALGEQIRNNVGPYIPNNVERNQSFPDGRLGNTTRMPDGTFKIGIAKIQSVDDFFKYIKGEKGLTSQQKKLVFDELIKEYPEEYLRKLIRTEADAEAILVYHELDHVDHYENDNIIYAKNKDLFDPEKIAIEVRATKVAIEKLIAYKIQKAKELINNDDKFFNQPWTREKLDTKRLIEFTRNNNGITEYYYVDPVEFDFGKNVKDQFVATADGKIQKLTDELQAALTSAAKFCSVQHKVKPLINADKLTGVDASRIYVIDGKAGCGKTTLVSELIDELQRNNKGKFKDIRVCALSHVATLNIYSKTGSKNGVVTPNTFASLIGTKYDELSGKFTQLTQKEINVMGGIPGGDADLIIIDECSMINDEGFKLLIESSHCPIIVIGDSHQLPPINEGEQIVDSPFFRFYDQFEHSTLKTRIRQGEDSPILEFADLYANYIDGISEYPNAGTYKTNISESTGAMVVEDETPESVIRQMLPIFSQAVLSRNSKLGKIVCYRNEARRHYNNQIHNALFKGQEDQLASGELIMFLSDYIDKKTKTQIGRNGKEARIITAGQVESDLVSSFSGETFMIQFQNCTVETEIYDELNQNFKTVQVQIPMFRHENWESYRLFLQRWGNAIAAAVKSKQINDQEAKRAWNDYYTVKKKYPEIDLSYAITSHKSQGSTYDIVAIDLNDIESVNPTSKLEKAKSIYTALTRARNVTVAITSSSDEDAPTRDLLELSQSIDLNKHQSTSEPLSQPVAETPNGEIISQFIPKTDKAKQLYGFLHWATGGDLLYYQFISEILSTDKNKSTYASTQVKKLTQAWTQRQLELIRFKKSLPDLQKFKRSDGYYDFEGYFGNLKNILKSLNEKDVAELNLPDIDNYEVREAQVIMGRLNATKQKLGNRSLRDIDLNFFKRVNNFYYSDTEGTDFLVRTHGYKYNIAIHKNSLNGNQYGYPVDLSGQLDEDGWRYDADGKKMYKLPVQTKTLDNGEVIIEPKGWAVYENSRSKNRTETIVLLQDENIEKTFSTLLATTENIVSTQAFIPNLRDFDLAKKLVKISTEHNIIKTTNNSTREALDNAKTLKDLNQLLMAIYKDPETKTKYINRLTRTLYNSFWQTLHIISARIPTQDMQSFMPMEIKAFSDGEENAAFVSRWQLWLQGSDMDIDKAYMMGVDVNNIGIVNGWSPLSNYSSRELAEESNNIPAPNHIQLCFKGRYNASKPGIQQVYITPISGTNELTSEILKYFEAVGIKDSLNQLKSLNKILDILNTTGTFEVNAGLLQDDRFEDLVTRLNHHNAYKVSDAGIRNIIFRDIRKVSTDPRNMILAYSPIDKAMDLLKDALKAQVKKKMSIPKSFFDGYSKGLIQEANSDGKQTVGIMANGIKVFFALTSYFNNYFSDIRKAPQSIRELMNSRKFYLRKLTINGNDKYLSAGVSDIRLEESQLRLFNEAIKMIDKDAYEKAAAGVKTRPLYLGDSDASLMISALISLATDNAKELALAKMNATIQLASMHIYLAAMGFSADDIIAYTTSPIFSKLASMLKADPYLGLEGRIDKNVWEELEIWVNSDNKETGKKNSTQKEYDQLRQIYNSAKELKRLASLLGINQGVKNDIFKAAAYDHGFANILSERLNELSFGDYPLVDFTKNQLNSSPEVISALLRLKGINLYDHTEDLTAEDYGVILLDKIKDLQSRIGQIGFNLLEGIDTVRYFKDPEYKQFVIDLYDICKVNFNVYDVINDSPNFSAMIEKFSEAIRELTGASAKANFVLRQGESLWDKNLPTNSRSYIDIGNGEFELDKINYEVPSSYYQDFIMKMATRFFDDYVISDFVTSNDWFVNNFKYNIRIGGTVNKTYKFDMASNSDMNEMLINFKQFMNDVIIPRLRKKYKNNTFIRSIVKKNINRRGDSEMRWVFKFNVDQLTSDYDKLKYEELVGGFNLLKNEKLGDILGHSNSSEQGLDLTFGDLLYLYNTLFNELFGQNSLSLLFDKYITDSQTVSLPMKIIEHYKAFDTGEKTIQTESRYFMYYILKNRLGKVGGQMTFKVGDPLPINPDQRYILTNIESTKKTSEAYKKSNVLLTALKSGNLEYNLNCN